MLGQMMRAQGLDPAEIVANLARLGEDVRALRRVVESDAGVLHDELAPRGAGRLPYVATVAINPPAPGPGGFTMSTLSGTGYVVRYDPALIERLEVEAALGSPSTRGHVNNANTVGGTALIRWQGLGDDWSEWYALARGLTIEWSWAVRRVEVAPATPTAVIVQVLAR